MPCFLEPRQSCTNICYTKFCSTEKFSLSLSLSFILWWQVSLSLLWQGLKAQLLRILRSQILQFNSYIYLSTSCYSSISPPLEGKRFETIIHLCLDHFFPLLFRQCHCHILPFFFFFLRYDMCTQFLQQILSDMLLLLD